MSTYRVKAGTHAINGRIHKTGSTFNVPGDTFELRESFGRCFETVCGDLRVVQPIAVPKPIVPSPIKPEPVEEPIGEPEPVEEPIGEPEPVEGPIGEPEPVEEPIGEPEPVEEPKSAKKEIDDALELFDTPPASQTTKKTLRSGKRSKGKK